MATISRVKTWIAGETLTAAALNSEFNNILNGVNSNSLGAVNLDATDTYTFAELIVGAGISSADGGQLHVHTATAGTIAAEADADDIVVENSGNTGITILAGNTSNAAVYFGDDGDANIGTIDYDHNTDTLSVTAGAQNILDMAAAGVVINEGSNDQDLRAESNGLSHAIHLDAGKDALVFGANSDVSSTDTPFLIDYAARTATAATNFDRFKIGGTNAVTVPAGTTTLVTGMHVAEPNITATGTVTSAVSLYVAGAPTEGGTNNYALWVDAGATQLDGTLTVGAAVAAGANSVTAGSLLANSNDVGAIGASGTAWSDLFLASGAVVDFNAGDVTVTHSANTLAVAGGVLEVQNTGADTEIFINPDTTAKDASIKFGTENRAWWVSAQDSGSDANFQIGSGGTPGTTAKITVVGTSGNVNPGTNDGGAIGTSGTAWSDLFLASGAVLNFNAGDVTFTHAANKLTFAGGDLHVADGDGVVIGHSAQVASGAGTSELQVLGTSGSDPSILVGRWGASAFGGTMTFIKSRNAAIGSSTIVQDNDNLGQIIWYGDDGTDFVSQAAAIFAEVDGTPGSNDMPTALVFNTTADGAEVFSERMRISAAGNVGIGTASPDGRLHVHKATAGSVTSNENADALTVESDVHDGISILTPDNQDSNLYFGSPTDNLGAFVKWNHNADLFRFATANAGASITFETADVVEAMRITSAGNVGIGTASPTANLGSDTTLEIAGSAGPNLVINDTGQASPYAFVADGSNLTLGYGATRLLGIVGASGNVGIGEAAPNGLLTLNQGATTDTPSLTIKTTDGSFNTGLTSATSEAVETDDYMTISKQHDTLGGVKLQALAEDDALANSFTLKAYGGTANTAKSTSGTGLIALGAWEHDGANALADITADGNVFAVTGRVGGATRALFLIDEDGDYHYDGADGGAFDLYDDASLLRAMQHATVGDPKQLVRSRWDEMVQYDEETLVESGLLGYCSPEDRAQGHRPLVNGAQLDRALVGNAWQHECQIRELKEQLEATTKRLEAAEKRIAA